MSLEINVHRSDGNCLASRLISESTVWLVFQFRTSAGQWLVTSFSSIRRAVSCSRIRLSMRVEVHCHELECSIFLANTIVEIS